MTTSLVTGGAGFVGSRLCEELVARGDRVICVDTLVRSTRDNVRDLLTVDIDKFTFRQEDVRYLEVNETVDEVWHLAAAVGPDFCAANEMFTVDVAYEGTRQMLKLALEHQARFLLASSSEIYGEAAMHPTPERYGGNLDPGGPRGPYAEGKRIGETLVRVFSDGVEGRIARLFNVYGPRMQPDDGRIVPTFMRQAMAGEPLTVHAGMAEHSRSYCFVDDTVLGLIAVMNSDTRDPVNLGHPREHDAQEVAELVVAVTGSSSPIEVVEPSAAYVGEPARRAPDLTRAYALGWQPTLELREGLSVTVAAMKRAEYEHAHGMRSR